MTDGQQILIKAAVGAFGNTIHSFIQRESTHDFFLPGFAFIENTLKSSSIVFTDIDHIAICIPAESLNHWTDFYCKAFHFQQTHEENVYTGYSGMNSKVVQSAKGEIKLTLVEPAPVNTHHK
jgi:4-hydroxymandelate synthase